MFRNRLVLSLLVPLLFGATPALAGKPGDGGGGGLTRNPIVFVHGWNGSSSNFNTMISRFKADGWTSNELWTFSYNTSQCINTSASQLQTFVNNVLAQTGATRVDIIAHSMGGLVSSRANIPVSQTVAIGSPFSGTDMAYGCTDCSCLEMQPPGPGGCLQATWWSPCDEIINPDSSAACGRATKTACLSHLGLLSDATVYAQVRDYVTPLN
jgi:triacylglycerol lipase